jgi:hypothetical protein
MSKLESRLGLMARIPLTAISVLNSKHCVRPCQRTLYTFANEQYFMFGGGIRTSKRDKVNEGSNKASHLLEDLAPHEEQRRYATWCSCTAVCRHEWAATSTGKRTEGGHDGVVSLRSFYVGDTVNEISSRLHVARRTLRILCFF